MKTFFRSMLLTGIALFLFCFDIKSQTASVQHNTDQYRVIYKGDKGPGTGKNIVFIATDHEYRGE